MSRIGFVAYGAGIAGITLFFGRETIDPTVFIFQESFVDKPALAVAGWLIATIGPLALSVIIWLIARRIKAQWLLHLIFIPMAIFAFRTGASLFFYAAGVSGDSMIGGMSLLVASGYLYLALVVHIIALAVVGVTGVRRLANGR